MKKLGFGTMRLPLLDPNDSKSIDIEQFKKMVDIFMEKGFTYYDTAYVYHEGLSEGALKEVLVKRYPRDSFTITTKLPAGKIQVPEDRDKIFKEQLDRAGVEYFDYYWLHCIMKKNYESYFEKFDCFTWLKEKKEQGLVKHIGFSMHDDAEFLDRILTEHPEVEYVQIQLNYLDWDSYDIQSKKCYEVCRKHNKPVIIMEPVKGGALTQLPEKAEELFRKYDPNASTASFAIRFAASLEGVYMVLSGMSNIEQVEDNTSYMQKFKPLTEEETQLCFKAAEIINDSKAIKCTGCDYCAEGCPQEIRISEFFKMYNRKKQTTSPGTLGRLQESYNEFIKTHTAPSECIECKQCEGACPQHLNVTELLKEVAKEFGK